MSPRPTDSPTESIQSMNIMEESSNSNNNELKNAFGDM